MDNNPQLSGCVPLTPYTTATFTGTRVVGRCAGFDERGLAAGRQKDAVNKHFQPLLGVRVDRQFQSMLTGVQAQINSNSSGLGSSVKAGQTSKIFLQNHPQGEQRGFCRVSVTLIDGIEYITAIEVGATDSRYPAAGLNLKQLPLLLRGLPRLRIFTCNSCNRANTTNVLPPTLPRVAPNMMTLALRSSRISGTVPASYGNFSQLDELLLDNNELTGPLPPELVNLQNLTVMFLGGNRIVSECC
jgi:hypothetical protein